MISARVMHYLERSCKTSCKWEGCKNCISSSTRNSQRRCLANFCPHFEKFLPLNVKQYYKIIWCKQMAMFQKISRCDFFRFSSSISKKRNLFFGKSVSKLQRTLRTWVYFHFYCIFTKLEIWYLNIGIKSASLAVIAAPRVFLSEPWGNHICSYLLNCRFAYLFDC